MSVNKTVLHSIRSSFLSQPLDKYHPSDVERVKSSDWWVERFVLSTKSQDAALKALSKTMEWRKTFAVNTLAEEDFPKEMYELGWVGQYFKDKEDRPVIWQRLGVYQKCSQLAELFKQFLVFNIEKVDAQTSHEGWVFVSDASDAGLSNMDMEMSNFFVDVIQSHYPLGPKYMICVDLPWILNATVKLILAFMNEQLRSTVKMIKRNEMAEYIAPANIPVHLDGAYDKGFEVIPAGALPMAKSKLTADQMKKFVATFKAK